ncbi:MAG: glycosyltransferase, partial [Proteobacteria bacterium]|nr:glycosyltransferase [Pseudomonadota bacterium]
NLPTLVQGIVDALDPTDIDYEILIVDDGSTDDTLNVLGRLLKNQPRLRAIRMLDTPPGRGHGQSAAFYAGFRAARGNLIVPIDGDLQNDPADIPAMIAL